jgi:hypothetical protein
MLQVLGLGSEHLLDAAVLLHRLLVADLVVASGSEPTHAGLLRANRGVCESAHGLHRPSTSLPALGCDCLRGDQERGGKRVFLFSVFWLFGFAFVCYLPFHWMLQLGLGVLLLVFVVSRFCFNWSKIAALISVSANRAFPILPVVKL